MLFVTTRTALLVTLAAGALGCPAAPRDRTGAGADTASATDSATHVDGRADAAGVADYRALGTEPFWGLEISGDALRFSTPDNPEGMRFAGGAPTLTGDTLAWSGAADGTVLEAKIWPGECSDNMSDSVWTHTAVVRIGATTYNGCAERSGTADAPAAD